MSNFFMVDILTPSKVIAKDVPVETLLVPTTRGQINILPEHTHVVTQLDTGTLSLFGGADDPDRHFHVTTGICKVLKNHITILTSVGEEDHEIDFERSERALQNALDHLNGHEVLDDDEREKFERKVERARLRIQMAKEK